MECVSKTEYKGGWSVVFEPVRSGSPENETFFQPPPHIPQGEFKIGLLGDSTIFMVGQEYFIDFVPATPNEETVTE
jgi:hypothetical protein